MFQNGLVSSSFVTWKFSYIVVCLSLVSDFGKVEIPPSEDSVDVTCNVLK